MQQNIFDHKMGPVVITHRHYRQAIMCVRLLWKYLVNHRTDFNDILVFSWLTFGVNLNQDGRHSLLNKNIAITWTFLQILS